MNNYELPSPYELSQIAATLRGREAGEKPQEAAREALALWLAAEGEICKTKAEREARKVEIWKQLRTANLPDDLEMTLREGKKSPKCWNGSAKTHLKKTGSRHSKGSLMHG